MFSCLLERAPLFDALVFELCLGAGWWCLHLCFENWICFSQKEALQSPHWSCCGSLHLPIAHSRGSFSFAMVLARGCNWLRRTIGAPCASTLACWELLPVLPLHWTESVQKASCNLKWRNIKLNIRGMFKLPEWQHVVVSGVLERLTLIGCSTRYLETAVLWTEHGVPPLWHSSGLHQTLEQSQQSRSISCTRQAY